MSIDSILSIILVLLIIYIFIKFVLSPIIKAFLGIVLFLIFLYIVQHLFDISLKPILGPFSDWLDIGKWTWFNWVLSPVKNFFTFIKSQAQKLYVNH